MNFEKYNWDLEHLLENKSLQECFDNWLSKKHELIKIYDEGRCYDDINTFKEYLQKDEELTIIENKLSNYISNKTNEDLSNKEMLNWSEKLSIEDNKTSLVFANEKNIILSKQKQIEKYLKDSDLKKYKREFDLIFKEKKHKVSNKEEELLTRLSPSLGSNSTIYEILSYSEIELLPAKNKNGKEIKFNSIADIHYTLEKSNDRELRKNAYISLNKSFIKFENTLAKTLYQHFLTLNELSKIYKYKNYIDRVCFSDEIETSFVDHVYAQVEQYKYAYEKFQAIDKKYRMKKMKLNKIEPWDRSYDIYSTNEKPITIEETQEIILEALSIFGDEYINTVKRAFDEKWISWLPKKGKQTGAYSIGGTKGLDKYYILMNFDKTYGSVTTIAHELGHSLNSYYINKKQDIYCGLEIFYAEIASITNEILLNYYYLNKNKDNKKMQLKIYDEMISNFFACTTRQIMFSETEKRIIDYIDQGLPVGANEIKQFYADTFKKYANVSDKKVKSILEKENGYALSIIFRLSHFYYGIFYVYKYSIGLVAAIICAEKIFNKEDGFMEKYFNFLSSGTSLSPLDTIKLLGIDLTKAEPWQEALKIVERWISNFKNLIK